MNIEQKFEDFLMEQHAENYCGLKDAMVDDFENWLCELGQDEMIEYADKYANQIRTAMPKIKELNGAIDYYGKTFIVQTVCKEDLKEYFTREQLDNLTDADMSRIASKISDAIADCDYWDIVEAACDNFKEK